MDSKSYTQESYENFLKKSQQLSQGGVIDLESTSFTELNKIGIATVSFQRQQKIEQLAETLRGELDVNILYLVKTSDDKQWETIAYSKPYSEQLYVIQMKSQSYGITGKMNVIFYCSLDDMFMQVNEKYQELDPEQWEILEVEQPEEVFANFMN